MPKPSEKWAFTRWELEILAERLRWTEKSHPPTLLAIKIFAINWISLVNDIDNEVVNIVRQFNDAFKSITAQREIKKKLRSILWIKYSIKDNDVFEKAYQYIEMYY